MKVVERIFEHRIQQQIEIDEMQFGFMKGNGTTDAIFMAKQMQENFRVKAMKLYFGFVDLEKAFDRVPREVISWALRKLGVEEWLVSAVMSMYTGAKTVFRTVYGNSKGFEVKLGMHHGFCCMQLKKKKSTSQQKMCKSSTFTKTGVHIIMCIFIELVNSLCENNCTSFTFWHVVFFMWRYLTGDSRLFFTCFKNREKKTAFMCFGFFLSYLCSVTASDKPATEHSNEPRSHGNEV